MDKSEPQYERPKLTNQRARLRRSVDVVGENELLQRRSEYENCAHCAFFRDPNYCKIVDGPVAPDMVCDWIQGKEREYTLLEENFVPFTWGMMVEQPQRLSVVDSDITPEGGLILIEDSAKPPHRFSRTAACHVAHMVTENHWTQAEVDALVRLGKERGHKPPTNFEEAEQQYADGLIPREEFEPFRRAHQAKRLAKAP